VYGNSKENLGQGAASQPGRSKRFMNPTDVSDNPHALLSQVSLTSTPLSSLNHAIRLQMSGIIVTLLGVVATFLGMTLSDMDAFLIGWVVLGIGLTWIIWGWLRLRCLVQRSPQIAVMLPEVDKRSELQPSVAKLRAGSVAALSIGLLMIFAGMYSLLAKEILAVGIILFGILFLLFGILGIRSLGRLGQES